MGSFDDPIRRVPNEELLRTLTNEINNEERELYDACYREILRRLNTGMQLSWPTKH